MMLPTEDQLESLTHTWVLSLGSNVHVAIDRTLFTKFIEFDSHVGTPPNSLAVKGVGSVELELPAVNGSDGHKLTLDTVLYVPGYICNVLGGPIVSSSEHPYEIDFSTSKLMKPFANTVVGNFEPKPIMHLRLKNYNPTVSTIDKDFARELRILVAWPPEEQLRYNAFLNGENYEGGAHSVEPHYDEAEIAWLKKTHKGEYCFLARNGLSIHVEGQRVAGRKLAREEMKKQYATEKTLIAELKQRSKRPETKPVMNANSTSQVDYSAVFGSLGHVPAADTPSASIVDDSTVFDKENKAPVTPPKAPKTPTYIPMHMRINLGEVHNK